jgi:hypothetical protein
MASKVFTVRHTAGKSVYFRALRLSDRKVFDFDAGQLAWKTNLAACVNPKAAATENTDFGDATDSLYWASINLTNLNSELSTPYDIILQAMDDDTADTIIAETHISVTNGLLQEDKTQNDADTAKTYAISADTKAGQAKTAADTAASAAGDAETAALAVQTAADFCKDVAEGDVTIDTTATPWELVICAKGTATELVRKKLYTVNGVGIGAASDIIGKQLENAL